jgi:NAD-dependent dihydropyrimidine dehydrogenase PreA subunit
MIIITRTTGEADTTAQAIADACAGAGLPVLLTPDLYHLPEDSPLWARLAVLPGTQVVVTTLHARPAEWLLRRHGIQARIVSRREYASTEAVLAAIGDFSASASTAPIERIESPAAPRWYPVVDRARCTGCHHCLQFCLFGVYALDAEGQVTVQQPDACKAGCPACSRICPHGAIIFPLYEKDPAIAGTPGLFMTPDAAARKMFYTRTKRPCPVCGATDAGMGDDICPECGRPTGAVPVAGADELDDLIAALDDLTQRRR